MKLTPVVISLALSLVACGDPNAEETAKNLNLNQLTEVGTNLLVNAAKTECENQLNSQSEGVADLVLTQAQKANLCSCVANELKNNINSENLQNIIKDGNIDTSVLTGKITEAMATCTSPIEQTSSSTEKTTS